MKRIIIIFKNILSKIILSIFNEEKREQPQELPKEEQAVETIKLSKGELTVETNALTVEEKENPIIKEFELITDKALLISDEEIRNNYKLKLIDLLNEYKTRYLEIVFFDSVSLDNDLLLKSDIISRLTFIGTEIDKLLEKEEGKKEILDFESKMLEKLKLPVEEKKVELKESTSLEEVFKPYSTLVYITKDFKAIICRFDEIMLDKNNGLYPVMLEYDDGTPCRYFISISRCSIFEDFDAAYRYAKSIIRNYESIIYARSCYYPNGRYKR